jgi:putative hydrolase of the HAD superfamily
MNAVIDGIKNIIFDLGGVILNIDYFKTEKAFVDLGVHNFATLYSQFHATNLFKNLETGKISPDSFIDELQHFAPNVSRENIIKAWNAMLLDIPAGRLEFLKDLKKRYRTFLLSNTNSIHYDAFQEIVGDPELLDSCFEKAYYSHDMGLRKPEREIYERVIFESGLNPAETLFIDDSPANVEGALSAHLKGYYLISPMTIEELLAPTSI